MAKEYTNDLINEDSPYLQQHAHNPVHWKAYSDKSIKEAKDENKLVFLSIGYSTCHWCHVMEHESFENEEVAHILNKDFISIKIDREEMPHLDSYYQNVYQLLNKRGGGWPLTIILSPDFKPIYAATYVPLEDSYGRKGIKSMLNFFIQLQKKNPTEIQKASISIHNAMNEYSNTNKSASTKLDFDIEKSFVSGVARMFDYTHGGIGNAPKFPHASTFNTLLDIYKITGNKEALKLSLSALNAMKDGGIYDQIEGGFYRYSVDEKYNIPHFEKMLYTNAELLESYQKAFDITKDDKFKVVVDEIVQNISERFLKDDMLYSASDADSKNFDGKGEEGFYFVFEYDEALKVLLENNISNAKEILTYLNISKNGNFEHGQSNPYITTTTIPKNLNKAKKILKKLRSKKEYPFIDIKIQTSWNAMFISSLLKTSSYQDLGIKILDQILNKLYIDEVLYHQVLHGKKPKIKAYLQDFAFLIQALILAHQYSLDEKYLTQAQKLTLKAKELFYKQNTWYMSKDHKVKEEYHDNAYKSALGVMSINLMSLGVILSEYSLYSDGVGIVKSNSLRLKQNPSSSPTLSLAYAMHKKGIVVLKAKNVKDHQSQLSKIKNPFVFLKNETKSDKFLACDKDKCFSINEDLSEVIKDINKN